MYVLSKILHNLQGENYRVSVKHIVTSRTQNKECVRIAFNIYCLFCVQPHPSRNFPIFLVFNSSDSWDSRSFPSTAKTCCSLASGCRAGAEACSSLDSTALSSALPSAISKDLWLLEVVINWKYTRRIIIQNHWSL